MRTLHVDTGREMRGGQWQVLVLVRALRARGDDPVLLCPAGSPLAQHAVTDGLPWQPLSGLALWRESRRAALTHAHDARAHTMAAALARGPLVVARRVAFPVRRGVLSRWKYRQADRYLAVSRAVQERLRDADVEESRISVVPDGVPLPAARGDREAGCVLALDTNDPRKGTALLRAAASEAGVALQFSRDLPRDLPHAAVFAYATWEEGLGSAALLAMAHGVPVVASRVGGLPEIVREGQTGLLAANEPVAFGAALRRLVDNATLRVELGERGRALVEREYTVDRLVERTLAVYRQVTT